MPKLEPPSFISETKSFETYKRDLERWSLLTDVKPELQAILVIHYLDGDPSGIKEKIDNGVDEKELNTTKGVEVLLNFLANIYKKDTIADAFEKYQNFAKLKRRPEVGMQAFIAE